MSISGFNNITLIDNLLNEPKSFIGNICNLYHNCEKIKRDVIKSATNNDDVNIFNLQIAICISLVSIQKYILLQLVTYLNAVIIIKSAIQVLKTSNIKFTKPLGPNPNVEELNGGGSKSSSFIFKSFSFIFLLLSLIGGNEISDLIAGPIQDYKTEVGFGKKLDVTSKEEMMEYAKLFDNDPNFGPPIKTIISGNLTTTFKDKYQKNLSKSVPINFNGLINYFLNSEQTFDDYLKQQTERGFNTFIIDTNKALIDMCNAFIDKTTPDLPLDLSDYFIKQLQESQPELEIIVEQKIENVSKERENQMLEQYQDQLNEPITEPTLYETINSDLTGLFTITSNLYSTIASNTYSTKQSQESNSQLVSTSDSSLSVEERQELVDNIKENVSLELVKEKPSIVKEAVNQKAKDIMQKMNEQKQTKLKTINRNAYLTAVCNTAFGQPPKLIYNNSTLIFESYPESRSHIEILLHNVITWGNEMLETNSNNQDKMKSLMEKAEFISKLLTDYDLNLMNVLTKGHTSVNNIDSFLNNIFSVFQEVKQKTILATLDFPITELEKSNLMKMQQELHDSDMKQKQFQTQMTKEETEISRESWDVYNKNVGTKISGATGTATSALESVINPIVNSGGNILVNGVNVGGFVLNAGLGNILNSAIFIMIISFILACPLFLWTAFRSGYIHSYFKKKANNINMNTASNLNDSNPNSIPLNNNANVQNVLTNSNALTTNNYFQRNTTSEEESILKRQSVNMSNFFKVREEGEEYDSTIDYSNQIYHRGGKKLVNRKKYKTYRKKMNKKYKTRSQNKSIKRKTIKKKNRKYKSRKYKG